MKLLIATPIIPYPLEEGGKVSQYAFLQYLQHKIEIYLVVIIKNKNEFRYVEELQLKLDKVKILSIDLSNISFFQKVKEKLYLIVQRFSFSKKDESLIGDYKGNLWFLNLFNPAFIMRLMAIVEELKPDVVQIEHKEFLSLVSAFNRQYPTIYVEHEILYEKMSLIKNGVRNSYETYKLELTRSLEVTLLNQYNLVLTFSEDDKFKLIKNGLHTKVENCAFPILDEAFELPDNCIIEKLLFVGGESHYPNKEAVYWYVETIAQSVFNKTGLILNITGKWSANTIKKYESLDYINFVGFVDDLQSFSRNSILIVPLKIGSGIRTKILYGLAQGLPVVSTSLGAEGIGLISQANAIIADDMDDFEKGILSIVEKSDLRQFISKNGYSYARDNFSQTILGDRRLTLYKALLADNHTIKLT